MTARPDLPDIRLPSTGALAGLAAVTGAIALAAVPLPRFSPLTNDLRAFAGAGLALWAINRLLGGGGLGFRQLFAESAAKGPWGRLKPALKTYALYLAFMLGALLLILGLLWAAERFSAGSPAGVNAYTSWIQAGNSAKAEKLAESAGGGAAWRLAWILLFAPLLEELFFRRLLYAWLRRRSGVALSAAVSAGVFGLFHAPVPLLMLVTAVLGVFLCRLYERQKDYGACVAMHALNNLLAMILFWTVSPR